MKPYDYSRRTVKQNHWTLILNAFLRFGPLSRNELEDITGCKSVPARIHELRTSFPGMSIDHKFGKYYPSINRNIKIKKVA